MPPKTTYTNADLLRFSRDPVPDQYGPWQTVRPPVTVAPNGAPSSAEEQDYDPFAALRDAEKVVSENQQFLNKINLGARHQTDAAQAREEDRLRGRTDFLSGVVDAFKDNPGRMARNVAISASLPVAAGVGLPATLANGYLAAEGISNAVDDPNATNVGLAALPFMGPVARGVGKAFGGAKSLAPELGTILHGAEMFSDVADRQPRVGPERVVNPFHPVTRPSVEVVPPSSAPGRVPYPGEVTSFNPADAHMPNVSNPNAGAVDPNAGADVSRFGPVVDELERVFSRYMPNTPAVSHAVDNSAAADTSLEPLVDRFMPNKGADWTPVSHIPEPTDTRMEELVRKFGGQQEAVVPESAKALIDKGTYSPYPPKVGGRVGNVHRAQTTGSAFGFPDLPKLSESELTRLQHSMDRVMKKR